MKNGVNSKNGLSLFNADKKQKPNLLVMNLESWNSEDSEKAIKFYEFKFKKFHLENISAEIRWGCYNEEGGKHSSKSIYFSKKKRIKIKKQ